MQKPKSQWEWDMIMGGGGAVGAQLCSLDASREVQCYGTGKQLFNSSLSLSDKHSSVASSSRHPTLMALLDVISAPGQDETRPDYNTL